MERSLVNCAHCTPQITLFTLQMLLQVLFGAAHRIIDLQYMQPGVVPRHHRCDPDGSHTSMNWESALKMGNRLRALEVMPKTLVAIAAANKYTLMPLTGAEKKGLC